MKFYELISLTRLPTPGWYRAYIRCDLGDGIKMLHYTSDPADTYGLAPQVRSAIDAWIGAGGVVITPPPVSADQLRAQMPTLTGRQLLRALYDIGITEEQIDAGLSGDPIALIEWKKAGSYERLHPLIVEMAISFNLPPEQVDSLWGYALTF